MGEAGTLSEDEISRAAPPRKRAMKGPVCVIECLEEIPCDVCAWSCPFEAVIKPDVTTPPDVDYEKCTGCGKCVLACPGLAIFMVELTKEGKARVTLPYEFIPVPEEGQRVKALDRTGRKVFTTEVVRVVRGTDKTLALTVEVPSDLYMDVRGIRP